MILHVIRHGETDYNVQQRYCGSTDISLNDIGREQAKEIVKELEKINFDMIISSPLKRAIETAEIIKMNSCLMKPIVIIEEFTERCIGVYEGLTRIEAQKQFPEMWDRQCTARLDDAPLNGETIRQTDDRIKIGLNKIIEKYADKTVLLVCHGFVSRDINRIINNIPFEEMHNFTLNNCQIISYTL